MPETQPVQRPETEPIERIVAAARRCFLRDGVAKMLMRFAVPALLLDAPTECS